MTAKGGHSRITALALAGALVAGYLYTTHFLVSLPVLLLLFAPLAVVPIWLLRAERSLLALAFVIPFLPFNTNLGAFEGLRLAAAATLLVIASFSVRVYSGDWSFTSLPLRYLLWAGVFLAAVLASTATSLDPEISLRAAIDYLLFVLLLVCYYDMLHTYERGPDLVLWLLLGITVYTLGGLMLYGLDDPLQRIGVSGLMKLPLYGMNTNALALPLVVALPLVAARVLDRPAWRSFWVFAGLAMAALLLITMSRSAWLGAMCGVGAVVVARAWVTRNYSVLRIGAGLAAVLALVILFFFWSDIEALLRLQRGATGRVTIWGMAVRIMETYPWFGLGPGMWPVQAWSFAQSSESLHMAILSVHAHSVWFMKGAEMGIPMLLIVATLLLLLVRDAGILLRWMRDRPEDPGRYLAIGYSGVLAAMFVRSFFEASLFIGEGDLVASFYTVVLCAGVISLRECRRVA